ncbi:MAG: hypothetical protein RIE32_06990 [Phycisphaerales bacterium]
MRPRRAIAALLVFVCLGAVATVLTSWSIHAVQFWRLRSSAYPPIVFVPYIWWPLDPDLARRVEIDPDIASGEIGIDVNSGRWAGQLRPNLVGEYAWATANDINADAAWRRHRRVNEDISPTPGYPFPFMLFETDSSRAHWRVLGSEAGILNDAFATDDGSVHDVLILVRTGWPMPSMEIGAHYAELVEVAPVGLGFKRVEEFAAPPVVAISSGIELWAAPRPSPVASGGSPTRYAVTDRFALPLLPIWPGFLLNTLLYALLLFIAWRLPGVLRRAVRRRRGRCVGCGYDRGGLDAGAACPECGAGAGAART